MSEADEALSRLEGIGTVHAMLEADKIRQKMTGPVANLDTLPSEAKALYDGLVKAANFDPKYTLAMQQYNRALHDDERRRLQHQQLVNAGFCVGRR